VSIIQLIGYLVFFLFGVWFVIIVFFHAPIAAVVVPSIMLAAFIVWVITIRRNNAKVILQRSEEQLMQANKQQETAEAEQVEEEERRKVEQLEEEEAQRESEENQQIIRIGQIQAKSIILSYCKNPSRTVINLVYGFLRELEHEKDFCILDENQVRIERLLTLHYEPWRIFIIKDYENAYKNFEVNNSLTPAVNNHLTFSVGNKPSQSDRYITNDYLSIFIDRFVPIISKHLTDIPSPWYYCPCAWQLVKSLAQRYYPVKFLRDVGNRFDKCSKLDDYLNEYLNIPLFDASDKRNIGKFTYFLMSKNVVNKGNFYDNLVYVDECLEKAKETKSLSDYENKLLNSRNIRTKYLTIDDIDLMTGREFEAFVSELFTKMGFRTEITKASGDQGIDVIAQNDKTKIGIQAKCYSGTVGNAAVQEVVAGLSFYNCDKGIVITNNYFTESAKELAGANNIVLWDRNMLIEKLKAFNE